MPNFVALLPNRKGANGFTRVCPGQGVMEEGTIEFVMEDTSFCLPSRPGPIDLRGLFAYEAIAVDRMMSFSESATFDGNAMGCLSDSTADLRLQSARAGMGQAGQAHVRSHFSKRGLQMATLGVYKRLIG